MFSYQINNRNSVANIDILFKNAAKLILFLEDQEYLQNDSYFL